MNFQKKLRFNQILFLPLLFIVLLLIGCKQKNPLNQDESKLIEQLQVKEANLLEQDKPAMPQTSGLSTPILEGAREIDPRDPPIVLDILQARNDLREITVNYIGNNIKYIPIRFPKPPDSLWNKIDDFTFLITPNNIIAYQHTYGITQFDLYGNFINQLIDNDFYYTWFPQYNVPAISQEDMANFTGSKGTIHAIGDYILSVL